MRAVDHEVGGLTLRLLVDELHRLLERLPVRRRPSVSTVKETTTGSRAFEAARTLPIASSG